MAAYGLTSDEVSLAVELPQKVNAPVKAGQVLGTVTVSLGDRVIETVELTAAESYASALLAGLKNTLLLAPILLAVLVALTLLTVKVGGGDAKALAGELAQTVQKTVRSAQKEPGQAPQKPRRKLTLPGKGGKKGKKAAKAAETAAKAAAEPTPAVPAPAAPAAQAVFDFEQAPVEQMPEEYGFADPRETAKP